MELDQILSGSLGYAKSSWSKVAMLGAILIVAFILMFAGMFVASLINNFIVSILIFLVLVVIALLAEFVYYGYLFRVIKASLAGINELPSFDEFPGMLIDGLKVWVVRLIYSIIAGILLGIVWVIYFVLSMIVGMASLASTFYSYSYYTDPTAMIGVFVTYWAIMILAIIAMLVTLAIAILFAIVIPMGIANMALKGSIGAAFSISDIKERISNIRWGKAILWIVALYFIAVIAMYVSMVTILLFVGVILVPLIILPYLSIFYARSVALLFEEGE
jgi:hypothetical protein